MKHIFILTLEANFCLSSCKNSPERVIQKAATELKKLRESNAYKYQKYKRRYDYVKEQFQNH